jgi:hypothetical protein
MANVNITGKLLGNISNFKKFILDSISKNINKSFFSNTKQYEENIKNIIIENIKNQPEYSSLKSGKLREQFGLANVSLVDNVLSGLDDMVIKLNKPKIKGDFIDASFTINVIKEDLSNLLSDQSASYVTSKGSQIDWLRWLLLEGQNSVIVGYRYLPKSSPSSRTGKGIMVSGKSSIYRVPPEFAGTPQDNWITRGLDSALPEIEKFINNTVQKSL